MSTLTQIIEILILRRRPQDISYAPTAACLYFVITFGITYIATERLATFSQPLEISAVQTGAQAVLLYLFLSIAKKSNRFVQTATAVFGTMAVISAISLALSTIPILSGFTLAATIWSFYILVLIFKDAFEVSLVKAIALAIAISFLAGIITLVVLPTYLEEIKVIFEQSQTVSTPK